MVQRKLFDSGLCRRLALVLCGVLAVELIAASSAWAQRLGARSGVPAAAPAETPNTTPAAPSGVTVGRPPEQFPPTPFFRGNRQVDLDNRGFTESGFYLSLWKFIPILAMFFGWTWLGKWVNEDSLSLKVDSEFWNSAVFLGGLGALLVVITMAPFGLGFFLMLLLQGVPVGLYIRERNSCVPESARLLTPRHIKSVAFRVMARLGIVIGGKKMKQQVLGPDIEFIGKTSTGRRDTSRGAQVENSRGFLAAKELVYDALIKRATDIHL